jgi:hypothetical protein
LLARPVRRRLIAREQMTETNMAAYVISEVKVLDPVLVEAY